jgi:hypothetical protein
METTRVYEDCWHGVTSEELQYETTDPDAAVKAVERLNGKTKTTARFEHAHTLLSIGGGNEGRYMAFFAKNVTEGSACLQTFPEREPRGDWNS